MSKVKNGSIPETMKEKIQYAVHQNSTMTKEDIRDGLKRDVRGVYVLLAEVLNTKECLDALADVFYQRYLEFHKAQQQQPELPLAPTLQQIHDNMPEGEELEKMEAEKNVR